MRRSACPYNKETEMMNSMMRYYEQMRDMRYFDVELFLEDETSVVVRVGAMNEEGLDHSAAQSDIYTSNPLEIIGYEIREVK